MNIKIVNAKNIEIEFKKLLIYGITIPLFSEVLIISCHDHTRSLQSARQRGVRGTVRGVRGMRGTQKIKKNLKNIFKNIKKI